jgi:rhodanese-related sulfurtransferase
MLKSQTSMLDLLEKIKAGLTKDEAILDVREISEYIQGHVPGSINVPLSIIASKAEDLKRYKTLYVHCQAGRRSQMAVKTLETMGLNNMVCISDGGFADWAMAGYPVER